MADTYMVTAERIDDGWSLEVEGVGVSRVRSLDLAADEMREAIAMVTGEPEADVEVVVEAVLPVRFSADEFAEFEAAAAAAELPMATIARRLVCDELEDLRDLAERDPDEEGVPFSEAVAGIEAEAKAERARVIARINADLDKLA